MSNRGGVGARRRKKVTMAAQHSTDEADIRRRVDEHVEALRAMDVDRVMAIYAPDIVSFDLDPPLQYKGTEAKRKRWKDVFAMFQRPLGYQIRDLTMTVGDDVAFGHSLNRISGTLKNGNSTGFWLRWTTCFRKVDGKWLIGHEQVSVPVDPASGTASLSLEP
jgi:ketosteroid isomerase-like protein